MSFFSRLCGVRRSMNCRHFFSCLNYQALRTATMAMDTLPKNDTYGMSYNELDNYLNQHNSNVAMLLAGKRHCCLKTSV